MLRSRSTLLLAATLIFASIGAYFLFVPPSSPRPPLAEFFNLIPHDAPLTGILDINALRSSPLLPRLLPFFSTAAQDPEYARFVELTGFDYVRDLDRLAFAHFPGSPESSPSLSTNRTLVIAEGRFDRKKITDALHQFQAVPLNSEATLFRLPPRNASPPLFIAFMPNAGHLQRIALSDGLPLDSYLSLQATRNLDPLLPDRLQRLSGAPIFLVGRTSLLPATLQFDGLQSPQLNRLLHSLHAFTLAVRPEKDAVRIALEGECPSRDDATLLTQALETFRVIVQAALSDPRTRSDLDPATAALLDRFVREAEIVRQDTRVLLRFELDADTLVRFFGLSTSQYPSNR